MKFPDLINIRPEPPQAEQRQQGMTPNLCWPILVGWAYAISTSSSFAHGTCGPFHGTLAFGKIAGTQYTSPPPPLANQQVINKRIKVLGQFLLWSFVKQSL
jgi:hypothetical protein